MALNYLSPLSEIRDQIDRIFSDFSLEESRVPALMSREGASVVRSAMAAWLPPVEITETENHVRVRVALPGLKAEDITVEVTGNALLLTGESRRESYQDEKQCHRSEFQYGQFMRRITLPDYVKAEGCQAEFKDGILELTLPKVPEGKSKRIEVKAANSASAKNKPG